MSIDTFKLSFSSPNAGAIHQIRRLVDGLQPRFPVDVWMSAEVEARACEKFVAELVPITVSSVGDPRIEEFSAHLWDLVLPKIGNTIEHYDSVQFSNMVLMVRDHRRRSQTCPGCGKDYSYQRFMNHLKTCRSGAICVRCLAVVQGSMTEHKASCSIRCYKCPKCDARFTTGNARTAHVRRCTISKLSAPSNRARVNIPITKSALNGRFKMISLPVPVDVGPDYQGVFADMEEHMVAILEDLVGRGIKFYISLQLDMRQYLNADKLRHAFHSHPTELLQTTEIRETLRAHSPSIIAQVDSYLKRGSGWIVERCHMIDLMVTDYNQLQQTRIRRV